MRDLNQIHPELQVKYSELFVLCKKQGLIIKNTECLRTVAEQDALYAQGRTKPGNIVTYAKGSTYSSMHIWGVAFDIIRNDGKGAYNTSGDFFQKVGKIGQSIGLEWGGSWKKPVDTPHFQLKYWGSTAAVLKNKYGKPDKFFDTWKHNDSYDKAYYAIKEIELMADTNYSSTVIDTIPMNGKVICQGYYETSGSDNKTVWLVVNYNGLYGYVKEVNLITGLNKSDNYDGNYATVKKIDLVKKADYNSDVLVSVPSGAAVNCTGYYLTTGTDTKTVWLQVTYKGKTGYIKKVNLLYVGKNSSYNKEFTVSKKVNLMNEPDYDSNIICTVPADSKVTCKGYYIDVTNPKSTWLLIEYNGKYGFIKKANLK